ncbi:MAG: hypothetical protein LBF25_03355 [Puniceicoccales bacterium]|nr:hypothetical protein [Puniceicoccales bacterium]
MKSTDILSRIELQREIANQMGSNINDPEVIKKLTNCTGCTQYTVEPNYCEVT